MVISIHRKNGPPRIAIATLSLISLAAGVMRTPLLSFLVLVAIAKGGRIDFAPEWFDVESDATPDGSKPAAASNLA